MRAKGIFYPTEWSELAHRQKSGGFEDKGGLPVCHGCLGSPSYLDR